MLEIQKTKRPYVNLESKNTIERNMKTICGIDCSGCGFKDNCKGCEETNGHPFNGREINNSKM